MIKGLLLPMLHQPRARLGVTVPSLLPSLLLALVCLGGAGIAGAGEATAGEVKPGENGQAQRVLRVGVLAGAAPCSFNNDGDWQGLAVELWARVARRKHIPYQLQAAPNATALLNDAGQIASIWGWVV